MCLPIGHACVDVPAAKLHFVQMKVAAAGKFSKEFVAAHTFSLHAQSARREAAQALRDAARSRQLREVHAIQFGGNIIGRPRQELRVYFATHFAAGPFRLGLTHVELQVVEVALGLHLFQFQLFDC